MMTTMKGHATSSVKPGEMEHMHIERAANGFTLEVRRKQKPVKANQPYDFDAGTERMVFNSADELAEHVRKMCGGKEKAEG